MGRSHKVGLLIILLIAVIGVGSYVLVKRLLSNSEESWTDVERRNASQSDSSNQGRENLSLVTSTSTNQPADIAVASTINGQPDEAGTEAEKLWLEKNVELLPVRESGTVWYADSDETIQTQEMVSYEIRAISQDTWALSVTETDSRADKVGLEPAQVSTKPTDRYGCQIVFRKLDWDKLKVDRLVDDINTPNMKMSVVPVWFIDLNDDNAVDCEPNADMRALSGDEHVHRLGLEFSSREDAIRFRDLVKHHLQSATVPN